MAAAGWNQETKARLSEKVAVNMNDLASLTKHVLRGSKSSDVSSRFPEAKPGIKGHTH